MSLFKGADDVVWYELNHNHDPDVQKLSRQAINNSCKRKAVGDLCERPAKIINLEIARSTYKTNVSTKDIGLIRHNINRNRTNIMPTNPKNIVEVHKVLSSIELKTDRQECFLLDDDSVNHIIIFGCFSNLKCLSEADTYYMDGTFKYAPRFFFQLFTIHSIRNGHYIPLIFCLLPNKCTQTYIKTFENLKKASEAFNFLLSPRRIILDFEQSIHSAVNRVWPSASIFGCRFHLAQSWYRKIQQLGLVSIYKQSHSNAKWLHHLFGLPYLHPLKVSECYVNDFMAYLPSTDAFSRMSDYLVDNYIKEDATFPPSLWASNSSHLDLTTNPCESFHAHFSNAFYHTHPNINIFIQTLLTVQTNIYIKIQSIHIPAVVKTRRVREAELFLQEKLCQQKEGIISDYEFVKLVSHRYKMSK